VLQAGKLPEEKRKAQEEAIEAARPDLLDDYQKRRSALGVLKALLKEYLGGNSPKAFVFIDELDRCRPNYAVSYLETIKHVFDIHGLVFVLAVDYEHLENSAKSLYGSELKFPGYFRKFVHRSFDLPEPSDANREQFAKKLTDFYLHNEKSRFTKLNLGEVWNYIPELISVLKMNPRDSIEFFRILGHATSLSEEGGTIDNLGYCFGMILMCALKVGRFTLYKSLGKGGVPHVEIAHIFKQGFNQHHARHFFFLYSAGFKDRNFVYGVLRSADLLGEKHTEESIQNEFKRYSNILVRRQNLYPRVYESIETAELM
jgi:hypothetical protein